MEIPNEESLDDKQYWRVVLNRISSTPYICWIYEMFPLPSKRSSEGFIPTTKNSLEAMDQDTSAYREKSFKGTVRLKNSSYNSKSSGYKLGGGT